jgi:hypothetical protein
MIIWREVRRHTIWLLLVAVAVGVGAGFLVAANQHPVQPMYKLLPSQMGVPQPPGPAD